MVNFFIIGPKSRVYYFGMFFVKEDKSLIWNLLKILTIQEVSAFIGTESRGNSRNITEIIYLGLFEKDGELEIFADENNLEEEEEGGDEDNNVISIKDYTHEAQELDKGADIICGEGCFQILSEWVIKFQEMESDILGLGRFPILKELANRTAESTFVFDEKNKIRKSYEKMKKIEIFSLYKNISSADIDIQRANRDDLSKADPKGVIIRKKQS